MKLLVFGFALMLVSPLIAQPTQIHSGLSHWPTDEAMLHASEKRKILAGSTRDLEQLEITAVTLTAEHPAEAQHVHNEVEELLIIKTGKLKVNLNVEQKILGPGSIVLIMPGEQHTVQVEGNQAVSYYQMQYRAKSGLNGRRASENGGSLMMDWNDIAFKTHDKGGVRHFFERPTAMLKRFEMHVTTLNADLKSHDPHTHRAAEIILMIEGSTKEQIDDQYYEGSAGDLYFLASESLHAIENTGNRPCMYFAFQFE